MTAISHSSINFLKDLKKNNNREWFNENKERFTFAQDEMIHFADSLLSEMNKHDKIETPSGKKSLFRIYKDVRFSKDKSPYKAHFSGHFTRATKFLRGGYYFHIEPGNSFVGGGFWAPNPPDLKTIREGIQNNYDEFLKIINSKPFKEAFKGLQGEQVKTAPRGFLIDDKAIKHLKYKQFLITHPFTDKEILEPNFSKNMNDNFKKMRPLFDFMSEILTTDGNGELIV